MLGVFGGVFYDILYQKFDCHVLSFGYNEGDGGYMTVIPISDKEYREKHPTKARVDVRISLGVTSFRIYDDRGEQHLVILCNSLKEEIQQAIKSAFDNNLIQEYTNE